MSEDLIYEREKEKIDSMGEMWVNKKNKIFNEQTVPSINDLKGIINYCEIDVNNKSEKDIHKEIVKKIQEFTSGNKFVELV